MEQKSLNNVKEIKGNIVDIHERRIYPVSMILKGQYIQSITEISETQSQYILPGFVDAHVHIESSMIIPTEFARLCIPHGTIATVSDPHEIANVLGMDGIHFMLDNASQSPLTIMFGAPSCVPATSFETAGSIITSEDIQTLLSSSHIGYLSEMMNYPGVIYNDPIVMEKIAIAHSMNKPIDGHAPGLRGENLQKYCKAGISTDHECFSLDEALEKISYGMKILIREGSAAKNYKALHSLIHTNPNSCMFCSDDKHPNDLVLGHINEVVAKSIRLGYDIFDVLRIAHLNPKEHYGIPIGSLQVGDSADFIICDDLQQFIPKEVYIKGDKVAEKGTSLFAIPTLSTNTLSPCSAQFLSIEDLSIPAITDVVRVIECIPGELTTHSGSASLIPKKGALYSDIDQDILKIVIINRYEKSTPALAFVKGIGLTKGAIASTIAHDSHNIICIGVDDISMRNAINSLIECMGGISYSFEDDVEVLPLNIAGLMSTDNGYEIAKRYEQIDRMARNAGSNIHAPFMTLSFLGLLVIPSLKLSDKGLFDGNAFEFTSLYIH